jgi:hypothetical protein
MALEKVIIEVLDKDAIDPERLPQFLHAQFNPTEYTLSKGAQIAEIGIYGIDSPILQFVRGQTEQLTLELFFDTTTTEMDEVTTVDMGAGARDVRELTKPFYQLVKIQPKTHAPPRVQVTWGKGLNFKAIVDNVQQKFNLFSPNGVPLRATLTIAFKEYKTLKEQIDELKMESANYTKQRVVQRGDTLSQIAGEEYHDPRAWRAIADKNPEVTRQRRLTPGTILEIPPIDVAGNVSTGA